MREEGGKKNPQAKRGRIKSGKSLALIRESLSKKEKERDH